MQAEKLLLSKGYTLKLIPMPRQFSSDCGIAMQFDWNDREQLELALIGAKVKLDAIQVLDT
jgi:hypothetical protein